MSKHHGSKLCFNLIVEHYKGHVFLKVTSSNTVRFMYKSFLELKNLDASRYIDVALQFGIKTNHEMRFPLQF